ncbi:CHC2 zinc finger domain-containing protein [Oricola indica]|uniref:CHC2 zinc finger domain-containing protein n=1 Tax=Oricola indica TaxID=2872591 RepID=UPI003CCC205D
MPFIDFAILKQRVAIESMLPALQLEMREAHGQYRGPCPACQSGGKRTLVVTPAKAAFYCFAGHTGGDVIALVAHVRDCSMKEAAKFLAEETGQGREADDRRRTVPEERSKEVARSLQPLAYLQADHDSVAGLGLAPETCQAFGAGYAPKGIMRGRLAIPIRDGQGKLVAYCGQAVNGDSPELIFPNGFDPREHLFHTEDIGEGEVVLMHDPLEVMLAWQNGIANGVSFLTETVLPHQLEILAAFMDKARCEQLELA